MNQNDNKILQLKKQIEDKKKALKKSAKFTPITNCSLEIDGVRNNINVLNTEQLLMLMVKLNGYLMSFKTLELDVDFKIGGYIIEEWLTDLRAKFENLSRKSEEAKLKKMESKLDELLSNEKRVELELDSIADMLKD